MKPEKIHLLTKPFGVSYRFIIPKFKTPVISILWGLLAIACTDNSKPSNNNNTKAYKQKFAKAFKHYSQPKDSVKLRALKLSDQ